VGTRARAGQGRPHDVWEVWPEYADDLATVRQRLLVNAIAATSPGIEWFPELLGLHIDTLASIGTWV
jgi:hypothetical protein